MKDKEKIHVHLSQDESDRMQKYLKEISRIYGIRLAEIGDFLGKRLKNYTKSEHQWFMAFLIIDDLFDEMITEILITLKPLGAVGNSKGLLIKSIVREIQERIKGELPLPKVDTACLLKEKNSSGEASQDKI
ncbi:unnamed protein product [marine sediment metagenome]|uniref:Uncharacterized protein n=1 Tax=marine sediment metagenome TaxID=412755 RepID=X1H983_9ZZZZ